MSTNANVVMCFFSMLGGSQWRWIAAAALLSAQSDQLTLLQQIKRS
jgi:hypothetical protein